MLGAVDGPGVEHRLSGFSCEPRPATGDGGPAPESREREARQSIDRRGNRELHGKGTKSYQHCHGRSVRSERLGQHHFAGIVFCAHPVEPMPHLVAWQEVRIAHRTG
ncbi:hypothetical protein D9M72_328890 [compost metagenome]